MKKEFDTSVLSTGFNDDRGSELNSSRTFLYVAFILSAQDYRAKYSLENYFPS
jgi:hypothetical protein